MLHFISAVATWMIANIFQQSQNRFSSPFGKALQQVLHQTRVWDLTCSWQLKQPWIIFLLLYLTANQKEMGSLGNAEEIWWGSSFNFGCKGFRHWRNVWWQEFCVEACCDTSAHILLSLCWNWCCAGGHHSYPGVQTNLHFPHTPAVPFSSPLGMLWGTLCAWRFAD